MATFLPKIDLASGGDAVWGWLKKGWDDFWKTIVNLWATQIMPQIWIAVVLFSVLLALIICVTI